MSSRPPVLDISALSPAEFAAAEQWTALVSLQGPTVTDRRKLIALVRKAVGPDAYPTDREQEIMSFFDTEPSLLTTGAFLACLRLIAHARTCEVLCRDHVFIQTKPLRLTPAALDPEELAHEPTSNPFRLRVVSEPLSMAVPMEEAVNPFRHRAVSSHVGKGPNDTPALSNATSSVPPSGTPSTVQGSHIPPLPPRPFKHHSLGLGAPQLPLRNSVIPPPRQDSKPIGKSSFEVIATSVVAPAPRRPRISPSALLGSTSYFEGGPPPILPKPKLISSTHIGPSTRMRPISPSAPASASSASEGGAPSMEREASGSGSRAARAPSLSSSSSDEDDEPLEIRPAPPPRPIESSDLARTKSLQERRASLPLDRLERHSMPLPPPPKRRPSTHTTPTPPRAPASRSQSMRYPGRSASMLANPQNRPLESFTDAKDSAQEWLRRRTMPAGDPPDRKSLLADRGDMGRDEEIEDVTDDSDGAVPFSAQSWQRLR